MEKSNSGMIGHGMPIESHPTKKEKKPSFCKEKKQKAEQMYKQCECDELFAFAKIQEGILILVGKFRVSSKTFKTFEEAEAYVSSKPYELIINLSVLFNKFENEIGTTEEANPETNPNAANH